MNAESESSLEIRAEGSENVDALHRSRSSIDISLPGFIRDVVPAQASDRHEVLQLQHLTEPHSQEQEHGHHKMVQSDPGPIECEDCNIQEEQRESPSFLTQPLSFIWRRLKWVLILSLGRHDSVFHMNNQDMKAAVATQLEVAIMGSALVLTLCLQIQEVVGSRGGFTLPEREDARLVFVSSSSLSFSFAFYSIVTSAMMLLSINTVPQNSAEGFWTTLSSWSAIPRLCTLAGAFCLGIAAMTAFFLGLENSTAWVGVAVMGTAILLTIASTIIILIRVKRLRAEVWDEVRDSASTGAIEPRLDVENDVSVERKFRDVGEPSLSSPSGRAVLTPLSSLTNTTSFSIRSSRFRQ